jgi:hypothetical protein
VDVISKLLAFLLMSAGRHIQGEILTIKVNKNSHGFKKGRKRFSEGVAVLLNKTVKACNEAANYYRRGTFNRSLIFR